MTFDRFLDIGLLVISFLLFVLGVVWGVRGDYPRAAYLLGFAVYLRLLANPK